MEDDDHVVSESESDSEDVVKLSEPSKTAIYNNAGLLDKLVDISWPKSADWIHKLSVDVNQEQEIDVDDDLNREHAFYTLALEGSKQAFVKLQSMDRPFRPLFRPSNSDGEMAKSDAHTEKVKGRVLAEKGKVEEAEERRKTGGKELAKVEKQKERTKETKEGSDSVKKQRGFAGGDNDGEMSLGFEVGKVYERSSKKRPGVARSGGKAKQGGGKRKNREHGDFKSGFGGKKGLKSRDDSRGHSKSNFAKKKKQKV